MCLYETSPYLCIHQVGSHKVVKNYLSDCFNAFSPWMKNIIQICMVPREYTYLLRHFSQEHVKYLIDKKFLLRCDQKWSVYQPYNLEIETSTVCNWACEYCPARNSPRIQKFISLPLFNQIIDKAKTYGKFRTIALHSYNEPTLDPNFIYYVEAIEQTNIKLVLYTNGSGLTDEILKFLLFKKDILQKIVFNFPSSGENDFNRITHSNGYLSAVKAIRFLIKNGIRPVLSVINQDNRVIQQIQYQFPEAYIYAAAPFNRAGCLYAVERINFDKLKGCSILLQTVNISIEGDIYLCCNDFNHVSKYGSIIKNSFSEVFKGADFQSKIKKIFGAEKAEPEFICRYCNAMKLDDYHCGLEREFTDIDS